ncbi:MAG: hypothetical protein R6V49_07565 [Bacteroidales bacterium]
MKKIYPLLFVLLAGLAFFNCKEEEPPLTPYELLTLHVWVSDSLLANGADAGGPGQMLEKFNGEAEFRTDGTGTFGQYTGTWTLSTDNSEITIVTPELPMPVVALIAELTKTSLKITTGFPDIANPGETIAIRMTFKAK